MTLQETLEIQIKKAIQSLYQANLETVEFQATRKEFEGDITVVVFPMLRVVRGNPVQIGESIGNYLVENVEEITKFNVVKGFLNLVILDSYFINFFNEVGDFSDFGKVSGDAETIMVEYSSPNTNKPLHLGHIRNILLGYSVSEILKASGKKAYKTQIINDRGIHICKSMLAWKKFAPKDKNGIRETPDSTDLKGDSFVGKYYVLFNDELIKQNLDLHAKAVGQLLKISKEDKNQFDISECIEKSDLSKKFYNALGNSIKEYIKFKNNLLDNELPFSDNLDYVFDDSDDSVVRDRMDFNIAIGRANNNLTEKETLKANKIFNENFISQIEILGEAQQMLLKWEAGDEETVALWKKMNAWVYKGFDKTYASLGVDFDKLYYESNTYLLGKDNIEEGLKKGVFFKKEDGSVWCDLTEDGLDEKLVLRSDGTAVYMTQDIGTAIQRAKDFPEVTGMIYTVGNEQDYHFKVLFLILKKLGYNWAEHLYHLSYGMVDLPSGKMKSREGTVVDADDLIADMAATAKKISEELGKIDDFSEEEKEELFQTIGLGALKYYILKVDPKKQILFNPEESVDFQGNTGPFIQYTYARIQSVLRKATSTPLSDQNDQSLNNSSTERSRSAVKMHPKEKELIKQLQLFPETIQQAAANYSPALIANYTYELVKVFNSFYQNISIFGADTEEEKVFRIQLSKAVSEVIKTAFNLLGIQVPERM
ncbi:MAG: arginine--tRNA ligase [Flavobacteriaceae bacterium]|nr:arginine--tRNA ligase [Flavobacteriaceae bacterium]